LAVGVHGEDKLYCGGDRHDQGSRDRSATTHTWPRTDTEEASPGDVATLAVPVTQVNLGTDFEFP
jgi:hypothetical protein